MIEVTNIEVWGFEHAVRGMRNPMNSWDKSDSGYGIGEDEDVFEIGKNDLDLMRRLYKAGSEHRKYLRQVMCSFDCYAPLYWWKEFDTYKIGTTSNSCSTMHKIADKEFTLSDFSCEHLYSMSELAPDKDGLKLVFNDLPVIETDEGSYWSPLGVLKMTVIMLNKCRNLYLKTKDKRYWWQMIQFLPSSYNQKRTVMLNYETLANIWVSRKGHKLDEWHRFRDWIYELPYSSLITGDVEL